MLTPPNNQQAEKAILASILVDSGGCSLRSAMARIKPEMFYFDSFRAIYEAMLDMGPTVPIDIVTLPGLLKEIGKLDDVGGIEALTDILHSIGHASHLTHYCNIVARHYWERRINDECLRLVECKDPCNIDKIADAVRCLDSVGKDRTESIGDVLHKAIERYDKKTPRVLYTVGYRGFDDLWGGCLPGEITTWAAAPGVGKSLLMVNIMRHCAEQGWPCLMVGTEMSNTEQSDRIMSIFGGPGAYDLRRGLSLSGFEKYRDTAEELQKMGIRLMDNPEPSLQDIETAISESKPNVVFIDYLTHCNLPSLSKSDPMRLRIKEFMIRLHSIARRHDVVVHLASQLNRMAYAGKADTAPTMGELAESSAVEQESSRVVLIWEPPIIESDANKNQGKRILQAINCKSRESRRKMKVILEMDPQSLRIYEHKENDIVGTDRAGID